MKENSLYEFYKRNSYQTASVPIGRNFDNWSKEEKFQELKKLLAEFETPSATSPRQKTYDLVKEIFNNLEISKNKIKGDLNKIIFQYKMWEKDVF